MTAPSSSPSPANKNYHVGYNAEEDRLLVSIDVGSDQEYAMALTRRLTKLLIGALADLQVKKKAADLAEKKAPISSDVRKPVEPAPRTPASTQREALVRDTVLNFEHSQAVVDSIASGDTRPRQESKPLVAALRLIREVKLTPKTDGGVIIGFNNEQQVLTLDLSAQRVHSFMAGILELTEKAGWNLPLIATWLDRATAKTAEKSHAMH